MICEGNAKLLVEKKEIVTKDMSVFYNTVMAFQRDLTLAVLESYFTKPIKVAEPLCGSGVRGVRIGQEIPAEKIFLNDRSSDAIALTKKHITLNKKYIENVQKKTIKNLYTYSTSDANIFLRSIEVVDFIDIDPYGSSIYFIESALEKIHNNGLLAITNTDTAALCGSYPKVTKRRYKAIPFNREIRHDFSARILIKAVQEIAATKDIALIPILTLSKHHYIRIFFKVIKSKSHATNILEQHSYFTYDTFGCVNELDIEKSCKKEQIVGPIYKGALYDKELLMKIENSSFISQNALTLKKLLQDAQLDSIEYLYPIHSICKTLKKSVPSFENICAKITNKGYDVKRSHFLETGLRTTLAKKDVIRIIKEL